jgi:serine/threonine protein kinase/tetratricopeptide (TPR) repeat protein
MAVKSLDEEALFHAARRIASADDRAQFLRHACGDDAGLAERVRALLAMHEQNPAEEDEPGQQTRQYEAVDERAGSRVGPYILREQIGEGGFGLVFVAEQQEPVRRKVALKVIKPGMDTRAVVARFEAERQALALMDHPNIAKVLDAGATDSGRPYFVMELVNGAPITEYADAHHLTPKDRLGLFVQVCQAVQHAHQKGIIHRDLKPSNVLVTVIDGVAIPKVIDFGVAKAVGQQLTDKTVYTRFAAMVGTPLYMSPEQAELSGVDVDTRADIYALGVLLYELLTGTTPFDRERFRKAAFDEIRRIIQEEEPPRPSTRLTSLGETLTATAARRGTEPAKLAGVIRGELDWIVMKCLEKDRGRRYETATGLAKDVQRHLSGDPVEACPPTLGYRLRKAYLRNKTAVLTAGAFAAVMVVATAVSLAFGIQATRAERLAAAERDRAVAAEQKAKEQADAAGFLLDNLLGQDDGEMNTIGNVPFKTLLDRAVKELDRDRSRDPVAVARIRSRMGRAYIALGKYDDARAQLEPAREALQRELGTDHLEAIATQEQLALANGQNFRTAESLLRDVLARRRATQGATHPDTIHTILSLGNFCAREGSQGKKEKTSEGEALYREALGLAVPAHGPDSRIAINCKLRLAGFIARKGMYEESQRLTREAVASAHRIYAEGDPFLLRLQIYSLRYEHQRLQSPEDFRTMMEDYKSLYDEFVQYFGTEHPDTLVIQDDIVSASISAKAAFGTLFEEADRRSAELLESTKQVYGRNSHYVARKLYLRGYVLLALERPAEARALFEEALKGGKSQEGKGSSLIGVGECLLQEKQYEAAEARLTEGYHASRGVFEGEGLSTYRRIRIETTLRSLIEVATILKKPDDVRKWQLELDKLPPK